MGLGVGGGLRHAKQAEVFTFPLKKPKTFEPPNMAA